jgi:hypothetical protein
MKPEPPETKKGEDDAHLFRFGRLERIALRLETGIARSGFESRIGILTANKSYMTTS